MDSSFSKLISNYNSQNWINCFSFSSAKKGDQLIISIKFANSWTCQRSCLIVSAFLSFRFLGVIHPFTNTPLVATVLTGVLSALMSLLVSLQILVEMMSIGEYPLIIFEMTLHSDSEKKFTWKRGIYNTLIHMSFN